MSSGGIVPCFDPGTGASGGKVASGAAQVLTVLDVNWPQLWVDNGSSDVDLSSSGTYVLGGTSYTVDQNHSGVTATLKATGLHIVQVAGNNFDWSISLTDNKASVIADYVVITADITATVSSRTSGSNGNGVYAVGYTKSPTWGTTPGNSAVGAGIRVANNSSQLRTAVIRNVTANGGTNSVSKVNPSTFNNRWYATGTDYMGTVNAAAFDDATLVPGGTLSMNSTYSLPNTAYPHQHDYRTTAHPMVWTSGNSNLDLDLLVTRTTWLAWPTEG
jgi:hypothetical protein